MIQPLARILSLAHDLERHAQRTRAQARAEAGLRRAVAEASRLTKDAIAGLSSALRRALGQVRREVRQFAEVLARAPWEVAAICDLFARAARERGRGFHWAGMYGALRWAVSRRTADRLLHFLEEEGHITVLDRGDRHTPRLIRMHLMPLDDVDLDAIRKARASICREWRFELVCAHRIQTAAPVEHTHCPLPLTDDPFPCLTGPIAPDLNPTRSALPPPLSDPRFFSAAHASEPHLSSSGRSSFTADRDQPPRPRVHRSLDAPLPARSATGFLRLVADVDGHGHGPGPGVVPGALSMAPAAPSGVPGDALAAAPAAPVGAPAAPAGSSGAAAIGPDEIARTDGAAPVLALLSPPAESSAEVRP